MKADKMSNVEVTTPEEQGVEGVTMRILMSPDQGAPHFTMRVFEVTPGGHTPLHTHEWEHEVFVLAGRGAVVQNGEETLLEPDSFVLVLPNEKHQFVNKGDEVFRFICVVPNK
jgi:quercetin dioxygenase-like cupin family protein